VPVGFQRRWLTAVSRPTPLPAGITVRRGSLGGRPAEVLIPRSGAGDRVVLHLHGGGFTVGGFGTHRALAAHLAAAVGAPVHLLDYRLAPEHPFPAALDDALSAYRELLAQGTPPSRLALAGDSAGGWLALAAVLRLREEGTPLPAVLGLVSPWLDLARPWREERTDDMLRPAWLRRCATAFAAGRDPAAPPFAVLDADLSGLPPIVAQVGTSEILWDDAVTLARRLRAAGGQIQLGQLDRLWHVAGVSAGLVREATESVDALGRGLARHLPAR
jgi:acetyl esterase/lipase